MARYICDKCGGSHPTELHDKVRREEAGIIAVDQWEHKVAYAPAIIETTGLGPCTGLIIYDPEKKKVFVGHFIDMGVDTNFEEVEKDIIREFPDRSNTKVWLGGITPEYDEMDFEETVANDKRRR